MVLQGEKGTGLKLAVSLGLSQLLAGTSQGQCLPQPLSPPVPHLCRRGPAGAAALGLVPACGRAWLHPKLLFSDILIVSSSVELGRNQLGGV